MALNGLAGHRFSHAPHPMQRSGLTTGILRDSRSPGTECTICMAPDGQCLAQFPHETPSVFTTQFSYITTACPICIEDFSACVIGLIGPDGHTSEHFVHSGLHQPLSKDISGCMKVSREEDGLNTC